MNINISYLYLNRFYITLPFIFQDRACEELDVQNELKNNNSDSSSDDGFNQNISQSKQSEALYEKNLVKHIFLSLGNTHILIVNKIIYCIQLRDNIKYFSQMIDLICIFHLIEDNEICQFLLKKMFDHFFSAFT